MISVDRGAEPQELVEERSRRLAHTQLHGRPTDFEGYDHEAVRTRLLKAQRYRCAYCELPIDEVGYPAEHFRPKACVDDVQWGTIPQPEPTDLGLFLEWFDLHLGKNSRGPSRFGRSAPSWTASHRR